MRYTAQKKIQLFLEWYDSRADTKLDGTLDEPLRAARLRKFFDSVLYIQILIR